MCKVLLLSVDFKLMSVSEIELRTSSDFAANDRQCRRCTIRDAQLLILDLFRIPIMAWGQKKKCATRPLISTFFYCNFDIISTLTVRSPISRFQFARSFFLTWFFKKKSAQLTFISQKDYLIEPRRVQFAGNILSYKRLSFT